MKKDVIFLYIIALACIVFALVEGISLILMNGKTSTVIGTIVNIKTAVSGSKNNSKWAIMRYNVDEKTYTSCNRIQVPMSSVVGSQIQVCYCIDQPTKLYSGSFTKLVIAFIVAVICVVIGYIKQRGA
ncbi:hypothetical protein [Caproicibacterium sp. BJN0003]|uniref:hypothetical protein n=1 Tax=Caproicibacterium sp. BJN0003 TaxID=2994078 RepID=UPI0022566F13|nr:hypothetical protein [Caproicibacterium sp. BJN0003]UZT81146.1 hypothetical protein OP489_06370 [Caproicibacterium sp. BJN0003]